MGAEQGPPLGTIRAAAHPSPASVESCDPLLELIGDARFVLLGEASHGTHEFYRARLDITRRLVEEKGSAAIAAEADWPDAYRVDRYICGHGADTGAGDAEGPLLRSRSLQPSWLDRSRSRLPARRT